MGRIGESVIFAGGACAGLNAANDQRTWTSGRGLIGLLVFFTGVVLVSTGRYVRAMPDTAASDAAGPNPALGVS